MRRVDLRGRTKPLAPLHYDPHHKRVFYQQRKIAARAHFRLNYGYLHVDEHLSSRLNMLYFIDSDYCLDRAVDALEDGWVQEYLDATPDRKVIRV